MNDKPERTIRLRVENVSSESAPKSWYERPLGLAIVGFVLTGAVGGLLTNYYQKVQWTGQQDYTARAERARKRFEVARSVLQQTSEAFSQNNELVHLIVFGGGPGTDIAGLRDAQLKKATAEWLAKRHTWRVSEKILTAETEASFEHPATHCLLADVIENRLDLERDVEDVIVATDGRALASFRAAARDRVAEQIQDDWSRIYVNVRATTGSGGLLSRLSDQMTQETVEDRPFPRPIADTGSPDHAASPGVPGFAAAITKYLKALCSGDAAAVPLSPNVRVTEQPTSALIGRPTPQRRPPPLRGADAARQYIANVASRIKSIRENRRIVRGNYARVLFDITLESNEVLPSCECLRFENGQISEIKPYFDPRSAAILEASTARP